VGLFVVVALYSGAERPGADGEDDDGGAGCHGGGIRCAATDGTADKLAQEELV